MWQNIREHLLDNRPPFYMDSLEEDGEDGGKGKGVDANYDHLTGGESCYCENDTLPKR